MTTALSVASPPIEQRITELLKSYRLPTAAAELVSRMKQAGHNDALATLLEIFEAETADRFERRVARLRRASKLPLGKTFDTFDQTRLPKKVNTRLAELATGEFLGQAVNGLAFGLPGTGKTHAVCALGHALVEKGHQVLFVPTYELVQSLLAAKRDFELPRALRKLDNFELLILDDIGYVQQGPEEVEVLFTLIAERYERRSLLITSNLVFSAWDKIFKNKMTTQAAIDRVVHHSVILEFDVTSYRTQQAGREPGTEQPAKAKSVRRKKHS